jgi:hypothetical protein
MVNRTENFILTIYVNKKNFCVLGFTAEFIVSESGSILFLQKLDLDPNPGFL